MPVIHMERNHIRFLLSVFKEKKSKEELRKQSGALLKIFRY